MNKQAIQKALELLRKDAPQRKFTQSVDFIVNLKDINLKQTQQHKDFFMELPKPTGSVHKICALVGGEMIENAKEACDKAIILEDFEKYDKKAQKKLVKEYDFFVAQANLMAKVAKQFGRVFGPKGRMPNPKAGCVVPPNANLKQLVEKLRRTVRIKIKTELSVKIKVGNEKQGDEDIIENCLAIYNQVLRNMPNEENNIKGAMVKLTMSKPVRIGKGGAQ